MIEKEIRLSRDRLRDLDRRRNETDLIVNRAGILSLVGILHFCRYFSPAPIDGLSGKEGGDEMRQCIFNVYNA